MENYWLSEVGHWDRSSSKLFAAKRPNLFLKSSGKKDTSDSAGLSAEFDLKFQVEAITIVEFHQMMRNSISKVGYLTIKQ